MKKILITGAGSGLGRGAATGLAKAGHHVIAAVEIWPQVTELRQHVANLGLSKNIIVDKLDVTDARDVGAAAKWDFDTLVNNAAIGDCGPMAEIPIDLVRRTFETNVFANLALTQKAARKFVDEKIKGRLIFMSSIGGFLSAPGLGAYCATKHAIECIAFALRDELAPYGISVQTINPGAYLTGFNDRIADSTFKWLDQTKNFSKEADVRAQFERILKDQFDPQDMIDKMVEVIGAKDGLYRNVWPPQTEALIKQVQTGEWTRRIG